MENQTNSKAIRGRTLMLAQVAVLAAIMAILDRTGLGYFKIGVFSLTIMMVPVIIGGITLGPLAGAVLGGVFGVTILFLPETQFFMGVNPVATIVLVVGARGLLVGFLSGVMFRAFRRFDKPGTWAYAATGLLSSLLNTFVLIVGLALVFSKHLENTRMGVFTTFITALGVQALIEAVICTLIAGVVAKSVNVYLNKTR